MIVARLKHKISSKITVIVIRLRILIFNLIQRPLQYINLTSKIKQAKSPQDLLLFNTTNAERFIELEEKDFTVTEVIVTCYFTLKPDPQTGIIRNVADFNFIKPWYESLVKIDKAGIILHDGLEQDFIDHYQTDNIQFRFCELGNYSIFEERWLLYHILLKQLPNLKRVFFTDSNDVYITKNPFQIINTETTLFVGRDNANRIKDSGWLKEECDQYLKESNYKIPPSYSYQWVYNAGVVGGSRNLLVFLTCEMSMLIFGATSTHHKDMTLLNIIIHKNFYPKLSSKNWNQKFVDKSKDSNALHQNLITGFPFNSGFKDLDLNSTALFIHK